MTKTKDLSEFTVNTRREKFQPFKRLSELSTEKIIEIFVQANPRKLQLKRVGEYVD